MVLTHRQQIRLFESSVEALARCLAQRWNICVVFKHDTCMTTGSVVYLPVVSADAPQEFLYALQGHLDHEVAHIVFTDFESLSGIKKNEKKLYHLWNGLEDPRVERKMTALYRGAGVNLRRSLEWILRQAVEMREIDVGGKLLTNTSSWEQLCSFSKFVYALSIYAQVQFNDDHWFIKDVVPDDIMKLVKRCDAPLRRAVAADHTKEVIECAREIMEIIREDEDPNFKDKSQTGTTPLLLDVGTAELNRDDQLMSRAEFLKDAATLEMSGNNGKDNTVIPGTAIPYQIYTTEGDVFETVPDGDRATYQRFMTEARSMVAVIKRRMSRSLLSQTVARWEGAKTRGKVDPRALFRVQLGTSKHVFRQRVEGESFNTAVEIMVDHSGSMMGRKLELAAKTAIVLGEILHQLDIPFSVTGFSTGSPLVALERRNAVSTVIQRTYTRWGNLWTGIYKDYHEHWPTVNHRLICMNGNGRHNTYDGESLRLGAKRLLFRPERRKILLWLNDGEPYPNLSDNHTAHQNYVTRTAKEVEHCVELVAVGIMTSAVAVYYQNYVVVNNLQDLPKVCLGKLDVLLRKGKLQQMV